MLPGRRAFRRKRPEKPPLTTERNPLAVSPSIRPSQCQEGERGRENIMGFKVAVAGATGNVGREMLSVLAERGFPADEVVALASRRSQGTEVSFGDRTLKVKTLDTFDFSDVDICLMSIGGAV
jgi:hypothetical protein